MPRPAAATRSVTEIILVMALCFGVFIAGSLGAVASGFPTRGFDDSAFLAIVVWEIMLGGAALAFLHYRGYPLQRLIPTPSAIGCLIGLALYAVTLVATWPIGLVLGARHIAEQPIDQMVAGAAISLPALLGVSVVNGLYEEAFLTGYLLPALQSSGATFAMGASLLIRALYHLYQGPVGVVSVIVVGLVFGVYFWRTRKLWPVAFAHIFADLAGFALR